MSVAMIASSFAVKVGLSARQLQLIPVDKDADCWFVGFRLQVAKANTHRRIEKITISVNAITPPIPVSSSKRKKKTRSL